MSHDTSSCCNHQSPRLTAEIFRWAAATLTLRPAVAALTVSYGNRTATRCTSVRGPRSQHDSILGRSIDWLVFYYAGGRRLRRHFLSRSVRARHDVLKSRRHVGTEGWRYLALRDGVCWLQEALPMDSEQRMARLISLAFSLAAAGAACL
eukprot:1126089-Prymnesium_polylepis.1